MHGFMFNGRRPDRRQLEDDLFATAKGLGMRGARKGGSQLDGGKTVVCIAGLSDEQAGRLASSFIDGMTGRRPALLSLGTGVTREGSVRRG